MAKKQASSSKAFVPGYSAKGKTPDGTIAPGLRIKDDPKDKLTQQTYEARSRHQAKIGGLPSAQRDREHGLNAIAKQRAYARRGPLADFPRPGPVPAWDDRPAAKRTSGRKTARTPSRGRR